MTRIEGGETTPMRKGVVKNQTWIQSLWPGFICLVLTATPFLVCWMIGPFDELKQWELGFSPWVWVPLVLASSVSFGLAHAMLRNDPEVRECRYWRPKDSILHGVGHAIVMMGAGLLMIREGYPPIGAAMLGGLILYIAGEGSPLVKDYMKVSF